MSNPAEIVLPAGKTAVLVDKGAVILVKDAEADKPTRIFTAWETHIYNSNADALTDIKTKGWKYTPVITSKFAPKA